MFSFGEAIILTRMVSYSPISLSSRCRRMHKAQEATQLEVLPLLCSSSQKSALGHSHPSLSTQTKPSHTRVHLRSSYPFTSLSLNFLFATNFHEKNSIWF